MEATRNALVSDMGPEIKSKLLGLKKAPQELQRTSFYQARALRALGLLLADGTPTVGGGKTF